eukprot:TRINITY_DN6363_c0_g1_i2.p2 TRINITY_DN6363_c0_g1~~TRINITY_DN6363_c0_g1_i2.p2  ORF type:complete len:140 (+),score=2.37 TRINITY_DN6363_c0_g1_i2:208-627(+)
MTVRQLRAKLIFARGSSNLLTIFTDFPPRERAVWSSVNSTQSVGTRMLNPACSWPQNATQNRAIPCVANDTAPDPGSAKRQCEQHTKLWSAQLSKNMHDAACACVYAACQRLSGSCGSAFTFHRTSNSCFHTDPSCSFY